MTPPAPATSRPAFWIFHEVADAIIKLPASISSSPPSTVVLSPNLCPMAPPGNASATPGAKYSPIKTPISARVAPNSLPSSGDRGDALELECYGGANRKQNGKDSPAIAQHSIPLEAATQPETA